MKKLFYLLALIIFIITFTTVTANAAIAGDINDNGKPDVSDARIALRYAVGITDKNLTDEMIDMTDYDYNGTTDVIDARNILRVAVKMDKQKHFFQKEVTVKPTCTKTGIYTRTCTECTKEKTFTQTIPKLGHNLSLYKTLKKPTCTIAGTVQYKCTRCQKIVDKTFKAEHNWKDATCTTPMTCKVCKKTQGEAKGHSVRVGYCSVCGKFATELEKQSKQIITYLNSAIKHINSASALYEEGAESQFTNIMLNKCNAAKAELVIAKTDFTDAYNTCCEYKEFSAAKKIIKKLINTTDGLIKQFASISTNINKIENNYKSIIEKDPSKASEKNNKIYSAVIKIFLKIDDNFESINTVKYELKTYTDEWKR